SGVGLTARCSPTAPLRGKIQGAALVCARVGANVQIPVVLTLEFLTRCIALTERSVAVAHLRLPQRGHQEDARITRSSPVAIRSFPDLPTQVFIRTMATPLLPCRSLSSCTIRPITVLM